MAKAKAKDDKGVTQCPAGTVLFREGESGTKMYVIKSGLVRMTKRIFDTDIVLEDLGAGDFCGEIAMVNDQARPTTATVIKDATVIQIESGQFENMIKSNSDIAVRMMRKMSARLTEAQFRVTNFTLRTTRARIMHQLRAEAARKSEKLDKAAPIPDNLADVLGLEIGEIKSLLGDLIRDELISLDKKGNFTIADAAAYDRFLKHLELYDHFEYRH